jgi:hypothetical protein
MQEKPMPATGNMKALPGTAKKPSKYNGNSHAACHQIGGKPLTGDGGKGHVDKRPLAHTSKGTIVGTTWLGPHFQQGTPRTVVFLSYFNTFVSIEVL